MFNFTCLKPYKYFFFKKKKHNFILEKIWTNRSFFLVACRILLRLLYYLGTVVGMYFTNMTAHGKPFTTNKPVVFSGYWYYIMESVDFELL